MNQLKDSIKDNRNIVIIRNLTPEKFAFLMQASDGYVRATDRDGDAVAIRESHYFKIPVLASDVVSRPSYCHLFELDNRSSLKNGLNSMFEGNNYDFSNDINDSIMSKLSDIYGI